MAGTILVLGRTGVLVGKGGARGPKIGLRFPMHVFIHDPQEDSFDPTIIACGFFCVTLCVFMSLKVGMGSSLLM